MVNADCCSSVLTGTKRIVGRVIDLNTGLGLSDVGVQVVGTTIGTMSGLDGRYTIANVPSGTVTLHVRRLGYQPKTVTGILLDAGSSLQQNVGLQAATVQLQTLEVTAEAERGSVNSAIDVQRNAFGSRIAKLLDLPPDIGERLRQLIDREQMVGERHLCIAGQQMPAEMGAQRFAHRRCQCARRQSVA